MAPGAMRSFRDLLGLSQAELGRALGGVDGRTVRRWEAGERDIPPPVETIAELAGRFPAVAQWLVRRAK